MSDPPTGASPRAAPRDRPLLVFDGDCAFCRFWLERWKSTLGDRVDDAPYQEIDTEHEGLPELDFAEAVVLVARDGEIHRGARAVFEALSLAPGRAWPRALYRRLPGFAAASEWSYRWIARHRGAASRLTRWGVGPDPRPSTYLLSRAVFLSLLGLVYAIAFASLWVQVEGLVGADGILPARDFLAAVRERLGSRAGHRVPTLFWLNASDWALHLACGAGVALSALLCLRVAARPVLLALWVLYLSLVSVSGVFLSYQWDNLLLETGLLAIFLTPWAVGPRASFASRVSPAALWLLRWLLFRLYFLSGAMKLLSGDPAWRELTAMQYHYFTQPLPVWTSYFAHRLPDALHGVSVAATLAIEFAVPFLIFGPRRLRQLAFWAFLALQLMIAATGNYGFFNLLSVTLAVLLLDDAALRALLPPTLRARIPSPRPAERPRPSALRRAAFAGVVVLVLLLSVGQMAWRLGGREKIAGPAGALLSLAAPLRSVNVYGLFAVMTKRRPEILIEGSDDGTTWRAYEFKWKPGRLDRAPGFAQPHMPRLDWQMWFAALGKCEQEAWFMHFLVRLLEGSSEPIALLDHNPFPDRPPRFVRSTLYRYEFASRDSKPGDWWQRERIRSYCPVLTLHEGRPAIVGDL